LNYTCISICYDAEEIKEADIMYLAHYNLKENPFQIGPDPKFMWLGENHEEALAVLEYGVLYNKGFLLITGDVGTGKTTLINALLTRLDKDIIVAHITDPVLEYLEFLNFIANEFNINMEFKSKGAFLTYFRRYLNNCYLKNKKVILIIDEAHRLDQELLEQIRLLSNIERWGTKLLNIFFVGQNEFIDIISDTNNRALKQRIAINYHLDLLKEYEIEKYIFHRLKVAGNEENIFSTNVIDGIFSFSKGCPRLINIICDHALLTGYVRGVKIINAEIIKECIDELILPTKKIGNDKKEPESLEGKTQKVIGEPEVKSSGRKVKFIVLSMLVLISFILLYYPGKIREYVGNIEKYIRKSSKGQTKLVSTDMPQVENPTQQAYSVVKESQNTHKTMLPLTEVNHENHSVVMKEEDIAGLFRADKIRNPISTTVGYQESHLDETHKLQNDPKLLSILSRKNVINFGYNLNNLLDEDFERLERITTLIGQYPNIEIIIKGYTDSQGNDSYNKNLSKFRANLVKSFFVGQGISPSRIKTFGMGPENPMGSNKTLEGRRLNRRVEIELNVNKK
jgi:general secretion pathway protein A